MPIESLVQGRITEVLRQAVAGYFDIESIRFQAAFAGSDQAVRLSGRFLVPTQKAYDAIAARARQSGYIIFFRREKDEQVIYVQPGQLPVAKIRWSTHIFLFVLTLVSVFFTGAAFTGNLDFRQGIDWSAGLSYALPLMTILLAHELGHFLVARHYHMEVSPPYFIPLPFISLGTLGAVIKMMAPPKNRRHLLQMAAAGPLAGLVFAIPVLLIGLKTSTVGPVPQVPYLLEGNSLVYAAFKWLVFGQMLPAHGIDVNLNNLAFAGWVGLLVTALNLIPAGQLDGGHAVFTLFGERVRVVAWLLTLGLLALSIKFIGWALWAVLLLFLGRVYAVPLDDLTPLDGKHKALAWLMLVLAVLLFVPIPFTLVGV